MAARDSHGVSIACIRSGRRRLRNLGYHLGRINGIYYFDDEPIDNNRLGAYTRLLDKDLGAACPPITRDRLVFGLPVKNKERGGVKWNPRERDIATNGFAFASGF